MESTIVSSCDVRRYGRMDAGFHIARVRCQDAVSRLEVRYGADEAVALLDGFGVEDLRALSPLLRGQRRLTTAGAAAAIREYPHLALALVMENLDGEIGSRVAELDGRRARLTDLHARAVADRG